MTGKDHSENVEVAKKKKKTKKRKVHEKAQILDTMSGDESLPIKIKEREEQISDGTVLIKDGKMKKIKKRRVEKPEEFENVPLKKEREENDDADAHQKRSKSNSDGTEMSEKKENKPKNKGSKKRNNGMKKTRRNGKNRKILESLLEKTTDPKEELENITQEISDIESNEGDKDRDQEMQDETKEHLDAEEKRDIVKKSRKRKKKEKNEEKDDDLEKPEQPPAKTQALAYLDLWKNNKNDWSFKKVRQKWLLKNLYNETEVDDKKFKILLEYLSAAKGAARKLTIEEAESIYAEVDKNNEKNEGEQGNSVNTNVDSSNCKLLRARQILQMLSE